MESRFRIIDASVIAPGVVDVWVHAPRVARHAMPGQFVVVRPTSVSERIPLTICAADQSREAIRLVVQTVGRTTHELGGLDAGDHLADVLGPLGRPTDPGPFGTCVVVAGGVGAAIALPVAHGYAAAGNVVIAVLGARTAAGLVLSEEFAGVCDETVHVTEDGTRGRRGLVTDALIDVLDDNHVDRVFVVGPIPMMKAVAEMTRPAAIPTVASLNPIMVDGTGMCGGCRVSVAGATRFACVDGPEFDAHAVDFGALANRNQAYRAFEACQLSLSSADG